MHGMPGYIVSWHNMYVNIKRTLKFNVLYKLLFVKCNQYQFRKKKYYSDAWLLFEFKLLIYKKKHQ